MTTARPIIHRVNLDIEAPDEPTARRLQADAARIFANWVMPRLEELLARLAPEDRVIRIDRLELNLDQIEPADFEQQFGEALLAGCSEQLAGITATVRGEPGAEDPVELEVLSEDQHRFAALLHFLASGRLPWWSDGQDAPLAEEELLGMLARCLKPGAEERHRLTVLLAEKPAALKRLLLQFTPPVVQHLMRLLIFPQTADRPKQLALLADLTLQRLAQKAPVQTAEWPATLQRALQALLGWQCSPPPATELHDLNRRLEELRAMPVHPETSTIEKPATSARLAEGAGLPSADTTAADTAAGQPAATAAVDKESETTEELSQQGIIVDHAGLVLLHPFLEYYFREFDLLADNDFRSDQARHLAAHLLHYLASGRTTPPEYLLSFEKFLTGCELLAPIPRFIELSEAMKKESDTLLRAAIGHWQTLKKTSPDGLREGFLQRSGKLVITSFKHRLIVENKGHDLLLSSLPWGYGIIKLPWLQLPLLVDWAY